MRRHSGEEHAGTDYMSQAVRLQCWLHGCTGHHRGLCLVHEPVAGGADDLVIIPAVELAFVERVRDVVKSPRCSRRLTVCKNRKQGVYNSKDISINHPAGQLFMPIHTQNRDSHNIPCATCFYIGINLETASSRCLGENSLGSRIITDLQMFS